MKRSKTLSFPKMFEVVKLLFEPLVHHWKCTLACGLLDDICTGMKRKAVGNISIAEIS